MRSVVSCATANLSRLGWLSFKGFFFLFSNLAPMWGLSLVKSGWLSSNPINPAKKKLPDNFSDWTNKDRVLDKQLNKGSGYRINLVIQAFYSRNPSLKPIILAPMLTDQLICSQRKSLCRSGRSIGRQRADGASKWEQSRQAGRRR